MKILKFRVWNGHNWIFLHGIYNMPQPEYTGEDYQFTGIVDKNGVNIYEGDICIHKQPEGGILPPAEAKNVEIFWEDEGWAVADFERKKRYYLKSTHLEVIGNIVENKYLIINKEITN